MNEENKHRIARGNYAFAAEPVSKQYVSFLSRESN
jgi:hypothetical protein